MENSLSWENIIIIYIECDGLLDIDCFFYNFDILVEKIL